MRNRLSTVGMTRTGTFDVVFSGEKFHQRIRTIVCSNRSTFRGGGAVVRNSILGNSHVSSLRLAFHCVVGPGDKSWPGIDGAIPGGLASNGDSHPSKYSRKVNLVHPTVSKGKSCLSCATFRVFGRL